MVLVYDRQYMIGKMVSKNLGDLTVDIVQMSELLLVFDLRVFSAFLLTVASVFLDNGKDFQSL